MSDEKQVRFELYKEIESIINKLEKLKLLDDKLFTEAKIHSLLYQAKSKNYIKQYLLKKGVVIELIEEQICSFYEEKPNLEIESALKFAKKRKFLDKNIDYEKRLSKMARAGFSYEVSKEVLK